MSEKVVKFRFVGDNADVKRKANESAAAIDSAGAAAARSAAKYGNLTDSVSKNAAAMARSADALGLPAAALRTIDDMAGLAAMGLNDASKATIGLNAATLGSVAAVFSLSYGLGTLAREYLPGVEKAADAAGEAIINAFSSEHVRGAQEMAAATANWAIESKKAAEAFEKIQRRQMEGMTGEEKLKFLRREKELDPRQKLIKEAEEQVDAEKKAESEARQAAEKRKREAIQEAEDMKRAELSRLDAVFKARTEEHKTRLKMQDEADERVQASLDYELDAMQKAASEEAKFQAAAEAAKMEQDLLDQQFAEEQAEFRRAQHEAHLAEIDAVGQKFQALGSMVGGVLGDVGQSIGVVVSGVSGIGKEIDKMKAPGAGILDKASGALGVVGIGVSAFSAVKGLLSGPSDEEKRAQRERAREAGLASGEIQRLSRDYDKLNAQLDVLEKQLPVLEEMAEKLNKIRLERTQKGIGGTAALFRNAADDEGDPEKVQARMDRLGVFAAAMLQDLRDQGLSAAEAFREMGPAIDEAIAAAEANGSQLTGALGMLADFQQKIGANEELATAAESIDEIVNALRGSGGLNQETGAMAMAEVADLMAELAEKGFTAEQSTALMAEGLMALRDAAAAGTIVLDENTRALIDQAEARGQFEGLEDPMEEQLKVQQMMLESLAAIAKMFGADLPESVQKYIDKLNDVPSIGGPPSATGGGGGGNFQGRYGGEDVIPGNAYGGYYDKPTLAWMAEAGPAARGEFALPKDTLQGMLNQAASSGSSSGGFGIIQVVVDGQVIREQHIEGLRNNSGGLATETRRHAGARLGTRRHAGARLGM